VIRHRPVKARAKLGARLVMAPRSASAVDQIACGCRKGQRPIADEVNKLGRFDAEIQHADIGVGSRGTDGSNPLPSSGESANYRFPEHEELRYRAASWGHADLCSAGQA
jgi:hypothetical protein